MKNVMQFLTEVRGELARVEWPSFSEFVGSTIVALIIIVAFSLYLGLLDRVLFLAIKKYLFAYSS